MRLWEILARGPRAAGFVEPIWSLVRVMEVIAREFGRRSGIEATGRPQPDSVLGGEPLTS